MGSVSRYLSSPSSLFFALSAQKRHHQQLDGAEFGRLTANKLVKQWLLIVLPTNACHLFLLFFFFELTWLGLELSFFFLLINSNGVSVLRDG